MINNGSRAEEVDFMQAARILECTPDTKRASLTEDDLGAFYAFFEQNKEEFAQATEEQDDEPSSHLGSRNVLTKMREFVKIIRKDQRMTDADTDFLKDVMAALETGIIPKKTGSTIVKKMEAADNDILKMLAILRSGVDPTFLKPNNSGKSRHSSHLSREVVLSLYQKSE